MPKPFISVIIPIFNGVRFIRETIQSVLDQTYPASEIIVVDDGSSDNPERELRKISGPTPLLFHRQENKGQGAARNAGASRARGNWLAFLDQDDLWYPHKLATQVAVIESNPEDGILYSGVDLIDHKGQPLTAPLKLMRPDPLYSNQPGVFPSTVIMSLDLFHRTGGFNPSLRAGEDAEYFGRLGLSYPIHFIPQSLVRIRRHTAQTSKNMRYLGEWYPTYHHVALDMFRHDPRKLETLLIRSAHVYTQVGKYHLRMGEYQLARKFFRLAFRLKPWNWEVLRRWGLCYLPGARELYSYRTKRRKLAEEV